MDAGFMKKVEHIRCVLNFPFIVASAYRCPDYNEQVSSTGRSGPHTTGRAIDIKCNSRQRYMIQEQAMKLGMTRFGIGKTFIHIDDLTAARGFDNKVTWSY